MLERNSLTDRRVEELERRLEELEATVSQTREERRNPRGVVRTFIQGYDEVLGGGIPQGQTLLLSGPTGSMKSSLALYFLHRNLAEGRKGVYISLEESKDSLRRTMDRLGMTGGGEALVDIGRLRLEHAEAEEARDWLGILRDFLKRRKAREAIEIAVIDPLNALHGLSGMEHPRQELFHFLNYLRGLELTTLLLYERPRGMLEYPSQEDFLADGVICLSFREVLPGKVELWINCEKMRHAHHSRDFYRLEHGGGVFSAVPVRAGQTL